MKKCEYCGKEISYFEQYCNENCHKKAIDFYNLREKYTRVFSVVNIICVFAIPIGLFVFSFANNIGFTMISFALVILGIIVMLLPFPTENMISNMKIKKATDVTRIIGLILLIIGFVLIIIDFIKFL